MTDDATEIEADPEFPVDIEDVPLAADVDRYRPISVLGKGGMGEIQLCKDTRISREVAVKYLRGSFRDNPDYRSRFLLEARVQGQLEHPAIVPVHDLGATPTGDLFFTMKRVRGITLAAAFRAVRHGERTGRLSRRRLLTAFSSVCLAVDFAHRRGVVHRDLKPANIMLGDYGEVYILDWGIAKVMHGADTDPADAVDVPAGSGDTPTRAGRVLGTPRYMAPERRDGVADPPTDVYALGVILTELLEADPEEIPPELAAIAGYASAAAPRGRYASARELHDAIERYLDGDRDLEARRRAAEEHAQRAEATFLEAQRVGSADARALAARDIGRALGMDPTNPRALRTLMRLLTDVPAELPQSAQAEMDRRWNVRRLRTIRSGIISTGALLLLVPMIAWLGVASWTALLAYVGLVLAASACQWIAVLGRNLSPLSVPTAGALVMTLAALGVLSTSMGLLGVLPAALAITTMAYRINVVLSLHGVVILLLSMCALFAPFVLQWGKSYVFHDGVLTLLPTMHAYPPVATTVYIVGSTAGAMAVALLYGRMYVNEVRRAERALTFHAWQLQQLVPQDPPASV